MKGHEWTTEEVIDILLTALDEPIAEYYIPNDVILWIIDRLKERDELSKAKQILSYYEEEEMIRDREERGEWGIFG